MIAEPEPAFFGDTAIESWFIVLSLQPEGVGVGGGCALSHAKRGSSKVCGVLSTPTCTDLTTFELTFS